MKKTYLALFGAVLLAGFGSVRGSDYQQMSNMTIMSCLEPGQKDLKAFGKELNRVSDQTVSQVFGVELQVPRGEDLFGAMRTVGRQFLGPHHETCDEGNRGALSCHNMLEEAIETVGKADPKGTESPETLFDKYVLEGSGYDVPSACRDLATQCYVLTCKGLRELIRDKCSASTEKETKRYVAQVGRAAKKRAREKLLQSFKTGIGVKDEVCTLDDYRQSLLVSSERATCCLWWWMRCRSVLK